MRFPTPDLRATIPTVSDAAPKEAYTRPEVLRMLGITERQLAGWEQHDLIRKKQDFAFSDLIALKALMKLRESKIPPKKIRAALAAVRKKVGGITDPLTELKILSDGKNIRVEVSGQQMEPLSGQLLFNFDHNELKRLLAFPGAAKKKEKEKEELALKESAEFWFQKGLELEQTGAPVNQVILAYERAAQLDPKSAGALVNLGTIYFSGREWAKAENCYKTALEIDPDYALAHFNIANLYDEKADYGKATNHYLAAVALNPAYADAYYNLALLYQGNGQVMEAVRHWRTYLKLDPSSAWSAIARRELEKLKKSTVLDGKTSRTPSLLR